MTRPRNLRRGVDAVDPTDEVEGSTDGIGEAQQMESMRHNRWDG